jgi:hypothetical protein
MIRRAVIHQAAYLHRLNRRIHSVPAPCVPAFRSGSQITSLIVMPGFVAPGIVAAIKGSR